MSEENKIKLEERTDFKEIDGFPDYYADSDGIIWSFKNNKVKRLKGRKTGTGYVAVMLCKGGKTFQFYVHRLLVHNLVRELKSNEQVNHINGIKSDNRLHNLEIVSAKQNSRHAWKNKLAHREQGNRSKLTYAQVERIKELREKGLLLREIGAIFEVSEGTISMICNGVTWNE